jgi:hypothetical protein
MKRGENVVLYVHFINFDQANESNALTFYLYNQYTMQIGTYDQNPSPQKKIGRKHG